MVWVPATVPPFSTLKPGCDETVIVAGADVWQLLPMSTGTPAILRLVSCMVTCVVTLTVFLLRLTVPVAFPSWTNAVVAVTGMNPSSLNDPVAGGSDSVDDVTADVLRSTVLVSVPGPRDTVELSALMNVLPLTG